MEIPPFSTIQIHEITKVKGYDKRVNLIVELKSNVCNSSVVAIPNYVNLRPGSSKVNMSLKNLTSRSQTAKVKSIVDQVAIANVVPPMLIPKNPQELEKQKDKRTKTPDMNSETTIKVKLTRDQFKKLFNKIHLSGIKDWSKKDHNVQRLIKEFGFLFALNDLDLGKPSSVKYTIKFIDYTPFTE